MRFAIRFTMYTPPPCTQLIPHPILPWGLFFIRNVIKKFGGLKMMCNLAAGYLKYSPENNGRSTLRSRRMCLMMTALAKERCLLFCVCVTDRLQGLRKSSAYIQSGIWQVMIIKETLWLEYTLRIIKFYLGCLIGCCLNSKTVLTIVLGRSFFLSGTFSDQSFLLKDLEVLSFRLFCFCLLKFYCGVFDFKQI